MVFPDYYLPFFRRRTFLQSTQSYGKHGTPTPRKENLQLWLLILSFVAAPFSVFAFEALCIALLIVTAYRLFTSPEIRFQLSLVHFAILVYCVIVILSILFSPYFDISVSFLRKLWHVLLFFVGGTLSISAIKKARLFETFALFVSVAAMLWCANYIFNQLSAPRSMFLGAYTFAMLLVMGGSLSAALYFYTVGLLSKIVWASGTIVCSVAVLLSHLRLPILLLGVLLISSVIYFRAKKVLLPTTWLILFLVLIPGVTTSKVHVMFSGYQESRFVLWQTGIEQARHVLPLGFGPNTFQKIFPEERRQLLDDKKIASWHNDYLTALIETGFAGLFCLVLILALLFRTIASNRNAKKRNLFRFSAFSIFGTYVVAAGAATIFSDPILGGLFWLTSGLLFARKEMELTEEMIHG